jgi:hypothetical protein
MLFAHILNTLTNADADYIKMVSRPQNKEQKEYWEND